MDRARSAERTALAIILETFQKREGTRRKVLVTCKVPKSEDRSPVPSHPPLCWVHVDTYHVAKHT